MRACFLHQLRLKHYFFFILKNLPVGFQMFPLSSITLFFLKNTPLSWFSLLLEYSQNLNNTILMQYYAHLSENDNKKVCSLIKIKEKKLSYVSHWVPHLCLVRFRLYHASDILSYFPYLISSFKTYHPLLSPSHLLPQQALVEINEGCAQGFTMRSGGERILN